MKKYLLSLLLVISIFAVAVSAKETNKSEDTVVSQQVCEQLRTDGATNELLAQRGCCSHHHGVCGCNGGRVVCCDRTYSPSCLCNKDDPTGIIN